MRTGEDLGGLSSLLLRAVRTPCDGPPLTPLCHAPRARLPPADTAGRRRQHEPRLPGCGRLLSGGLGVHVYRPNVHGLVGRAP